MSNSNNNMITQSRRWAKFTNKSRLYIVLFALMLPTFGGMLVFNYYPKFGAIKYSFFLWDGSTIEEFRGFRNFVEAFTKDALFWQTFKLAGILLVANLAKMWPCIFAAIVLHRLKSMKWQYFYRVLFVIPMVIPGLVWLLLWKSFYDPTEGILNAFLNATGLMNVLQWLDTAMPQLAGFVSPVCSTAINPAFTSVWGLGLFGIVVLSMIAGFGAFRKLWLWWLILGVASYFVWGQTRTFIILPAVMVITHLLSGSFAGRDIMKWIGATAIVAAVAVILTSMIWTEPIEVFKFGTPAWLGNDKLIVPSLIFWGFPWVGTVGVLIYLAGLQNISQDVYEAAELDGVGPVRKLFQIELPLIMAQVKINLIFMTIGTLNSYGLILLLLGPTGGPGNKGMVPGLYMFREAFFNFRLGYACALGMVLFVLILGLTVFYQKYVKVEK